MALRDAVQNTFKGLDTDVLEYLISMVEDHGLGDDDIKEQVSMFLQSADYCDTEEAAMEAVNKLEKELTELNIINSSSNADDDNNVKVLTKAINMSDVSETNLTSDFLLGTTVNPLLDIRNESFQSSGAKVSKRDARRAKRKEANKKKIQQNENEDEAIGMAEIQSAMYSDDTTPGDVALPNFDLPNKKGSGPDLLVDANITFSQGRRYGLVGKNGVGKSTFMEAFSKREIHGLKWVNQNVLLVKQEVEGNKMNPVEWLMKSDGRRAHLQKEIEKLSNSKDVENSSKLTELYEKLSLLDSTKGEQHARSILRGLGFDEEMQTAATKSLSGGWRRRVALACALFIKPDILLLDEPTNHLDLETVIWLQNFLTSKDFVQTLLVVSHDRNFLNFVVTDIVLFRNTKLEVYKGDYFSFLRTMEQNKITKQRQREAQEMKRQHLQEYITKHAQAGENGPKAARQRKSRMKKLERLGMEAAATNAGRKFKQSYDGAIEDVEEEQEEKEMTLNFPDPGKIDGTIIRMDSVEFMYPNNKKLHLRNIEMTLDQSSRVAILGRNGCGKSTLIKLIMGSVHPKTGAVILKQNCRIEYIAQHHSEELDMDSTPLETMLKRFPGDCSLTHQNEMRTYIAKFGLVGTTLPTQKIHTLSGGQKCRVALALALYKKPHFLIMDEPTNHLDMETTMALISAIKEFKGGVLIVSHDEYLLKEACNEIWYVKENGLHTFKEGFSGYKKLVLKGKH